MRNPRRNIFGPCTIRPICFMQSTRENTVPMQRKGPTHNTTVCTCTSFFTCFTCSFSCFAHIIALFALYRSLTLCLLCFCWEHMPTWQANLRTCSVASHCGHTFLRRIDIPDCRFRPTEEKSTTRFASKFT